jgi:hypothetical protein
VIQLKAFPAGLILEKESPMPPTSAPVQVSQDLSQSNPSSPQRSERPYLGEKEPKFVIKLASPIPA